MNSAIRHRLVHSLSLSLLQEETKKLVEQGWRPIGDPALAAPVDIKRPPYWTQAMYLGSEPIPLETHRIEPPAGSRAAAAFGGSSGRSNAP